jgi:hypothetical protein
MITKPILRPLVLGMVLLWTPGALAVAVAVDYDHAGLIQIQIKSGRMHYVWHTARKFAPGETAPIRQDMSHYDRHEVSIWLTGEEVDAVAKWMDTHAVLALPTDYPAKKERTRGAAYRSSLSVTLEDRERNIAWHGDSLPSEELRAAEKALIQICDGIRRDRER